MEKIVFISEDLLVHEQKDESIELHSFVGNLRAVIAISRSDHQYYPTYFSESKYGTKANLFVWTLHVSGLELGSGFKVTRISEQPDSRRYKNYFTELNVQVQDRLSQVKNFTFLIRPRVVFDIGLVSWLLQELVTTLDGAESLKMWTLKDKLRKVETELSKVKAELKEKESSLDSLTKELQGLRST